MKKVNLFCNKLSLSVKAIFNSEIWTLKKVSKEKLKYKIVLYKWNVILSNYFLWFEKKLRQFNFF